MVSPFIIIKIKGEISMAKNILLLGASGTAGSGVRKALLSQTDTHLTLVSRHANQLTILNEKD